MFGTVTLRDSLCVNTAEAGQGRGVTATTGAASTSTATLDNVTAVGLFGIAVRTEGGSSMAIDGTNVIASGSDDDLRLRTDSSVGVSSTIRLSHSDFSTHLRDLSVLEPGELDLDRAPRTSALTCGAALTVDMGAYQSPGGTCAPPSSSSALPPPAPAPTAPAPAPPGPAGPRVRVNCPMSAKPGGCKLALQVVSGKPKLVKGKVRRPRPESAVARVELGARLLVREVETVKGATQTVYRRLKVVR